MQKSNDERQQIDYQSYKRSTQHTGAQPRPILLRAMAFLLLLTGLLLLVVSHFDAATRDA
jgi:hypothetical protein